MKKKVIGSCLVALLISSNLVGIPQAIATEITESSEEILTSSESNVTETTDSSLSKSELSTESSSTESSRLSSESEIQEERFQSSNPEIQAIIDSYTDEELANAVGEDGLGERIKQDTPMRMQRSRSNSFPNVNQYIKQKKFKNPVIKQDSRAGILPKISYKYGQPIGIVVHETANPNSNINGEVNFMYSNYRNAFVHAFVSDNQVIETADKNYLGWGAGRYANPLFLHIELVQSKTFDSFAHSVNSDAYWIALQLHQFGLLPSFGDNNGIGTVISHNAISKFYGGTNHTDPYGYFSRWGYSMSQFYQLVELKYKEISDEQNQPTVTIEETENMNEFMKIANLSDFFYKEPVTKQEQHKLSAIGESSKINEEVKVIKKITMSDGTESYQLSNKLYVKVSSLKRYATIVETNTINRPMKVADDAYYLYNKPYNTHGAKRQGKIETKFKNGTAVHVKAKLKTSEGIRVYQLDNGQFVDHRSLTDFATIVETNTINRPMKVADDAYYLYNKPYNTHGAKRQGKIETKFKNGTAVHVKAKLKTSEGIRVYQLDNGQFVDHRSLTDFASIVKTEEIKQPMRLNKTTFYVYNLPFGTYKSQRLYRLDTKYKKNDEVFVNKRITTSEGIVIYEINNIGFVDHRSLKSSSSIKTTQNIDLNWRITNPNYNIYSQPFLTPGSKKIDTVKNYRNNTSMNARLTKKVVTSDNVTTYYINGIGWVDHRAVGPHATLATNKKVNKNQWINNTNYYIYNKPYGTVGSERVQPLSQYVKNNSKSVTTIAEAKTTEGINVVQLKGIGWVDKRAVIDQQAHKMRNVQNHLNKKYNQPRFGIQVISLTDGSVASINGNKSFTAASTGKLPAIYYTQKRLNDGSLKPNQQFLYHNRINQMTGYSYQPGGAGILQNRPFGGYYSIDTILNWTIKYSDNQGANFLGYYGANQFSPSMRKEISSIIGRTWRSPFTITAKENALLMRSIYYQGGVANHYLQNTVYDNQRIPKYLPVKVGHKIGDVYDYRHDVAIVYAKQPYVISVMTSNYTSYETISLLSKEVYDLLK